MGHTTIIGPTGAGKSTLMNFLCAQAQKFNCRMFFFDKNWREWKPAIIGSVNRDGGDWRAHFTSYTLNLGHGRSSSDGEFFIADCQKKHDSPLILIDLRTGANQILCWPDASNDGGHPASAHVHPSFSPKGNFITYTSDRSGTPQVYVLPVNDLCGSER